MESIAKRQDQSDYENNNSISGIRDEAESKALAG